MLIAVVPLGTFTITASAATEYTEGSYKYTVENEYATITKYTGSASTVTIPSELGGYTVIIIGNNAFEGKSLKSVVISDSVTTIKNHVFKNCAYLTNVTFSDSVKTIGDFSFEGCKALTSITLPDSITSIGSGAFYNSTALKNVTLSKNLTSLGGAAFYKTAIESIEIPKSLDTCGDSWYYDYKFGNVTYSGLFGGPFLLCDTLKTVTFEEGTTQIAKNLFRLCTGLEEITIPNTVTTIENCAFDNCFNLKSVTIGDSVTQMGDYCFSGCRSLTEITIPNSVTNINARAFGDCEKLKNVTLSKNLTYMGGAVFLNTAIESIEIPKSLNKCDTSWYFEYKFGDKTYGGLFGGPFTFCHNLKTVTFEEGTTKIAQQLFRCCTGLEEIVIPDTVTSIETSAFEDCFNLNTVKIGNNVISIGNGAFYICPSLIEVNIPDSVTTLGSGVFQNNTSLKSIEISDSVTSMGTSCFENCASLESVKLPENLNSVVSYTFKNCTSLKKIELPQTVTTIQKEAFYGCTALEEIILPEQVKTIDSNTFQNCTSLKKVYIPQSTKNIYSKAFMGCEKLTDITIVDYSITTLTSQTFKDCAALKKITLPKGLTKIEGEVFNNSTALTEIYIPESVTSIDSTALPYPDKTTIYGKAGSYAETFAKDNGFKFVDNTVAAVGVSLVDGIESIAMDRGETYRAKFEFFPEDSTDVITLTANNNNVSINGHDIYANRTGETVVTATASSGVNYQFTITIRDAQKISVTNQPDKVSYLLDEELDLTGLVVQVNYSDGTTREVTDYTVSGFDNSREGDCVVTVQWVSSANSTYKTTFTVNIVDPRPKLTGIVIENLPIKLEYERKEALDLSGMVVKANYTDGSTVEITDYICSGYNALKNGAQTITVTYGDYTATFTVMVGIKLEGIKITSQPQIIKYSLGDKLNTEGLVLTLTYTDGSTTTITEGFTVSGFDSETEGEKTVTVTYGDFSDTFTVTVRDKSAVAIGDINGDTNINNKDLGLLMQHLNNWNVEIIIDAADVNGDGSVNNKDYGLLMQYLNNWDVELG